MTYIKRYIHIIKLPLLLGCFTLLSIMGVSGQNDVSKDSLKAQKLNRQFEFTIKQKKYTEAMTIGKEALQIADKYLLVSSKIKTLRLFGQLYTQTNKTSEALTNFLQAESVCQNYNAETRLIDVYDDLGIFYRKLSLYKKALQYFRQAYQLRLKNKYNRGVASNIDNIASSCYVLGNYNLSYVFYERLQKLYEKQKKQALRIKTLEKLALVASIDKSYSKAIKYNLTLLDLYKKKGDLNKISNVYNDLGFLHQRRDDVQEAINYFSLSSEVIKQKKLSISDEQRITLLLNTGVAYTNLESFNRAKKHFQQASQLAIRNPLKQAEIHNYTGSNYYLSGNNFQALNEVEKAIAIARPKRAWNVLLTSYDLLSRIHQEERNNKKAQEFKIRYLATAQKIKEEELKEQKQAASNQALMDQQERRIKNILAQQRQFKALQSIQERQKRDLELKNNLVQLQKNQLALLKKDKELNIANIQKAQLDKVRQEQALLISQGKLRETKLERDKTKSVLALERRKAAEKLRAEQNRRKVAALEQQRKLQQQEIEQQKIKEKYAIGIIILIGAILGLVSWFWFMTRRNKRKVQNQNDEILTQKVKIEEQNAEILAQNEELYQKQEEVTTTNQVLEEQNIQIGQSIKAAQTIQEAMSPNLSKMNNMLPEHFLIYRPKDMVSGDFYWLEQIGNKIMVAAVDCTGHGVPGAFMSMIGNSLLNRIIQVQKILSPKQILTQLNFEIENVLRQQERGYRNGMDMVLVTWEKDQNQDQIKLTFAGAKRPLYFLSKNAENRLNKVKGNRYSIGSKDPVFNEKSLTLEKGDSIYLSSDGYIDQNDVQRRKFGYKKFESTLCEIQQLSMGEQKERLENLLDEHMHNASQRDDILLMGIRF